MGEIKWIIIAGIMDVLHIYIAEIMDVLILLIYIATDICFLFLLLKVTNQILFEFKYKTYPWTNHIIIIIALTIDI